jgi:hypothetical protein
MMQRVRDFWTRKRRYAVRLFIDEDLSLADAVETIFKPNDDAAFDRAFAAVEAELRAHVQDLEQKLDDVRDAARAR